jgi:hypothetical protein
MGDDEQRLIEEARRSREETEKLREHGFGDEPGSSDEEDEGSDDEDGQAS